MLESEEIKHLLQKNSEFNQDVEMLSSEDKELITQLFKKPFEAVAKATNKILAKECEINDVSVDIVNASLLKETLSNDYYLIDVIYKTGLSAFAFENTSVKKMASILLETMYEEGELTETEINSFKEIISQMVSGLGRALSSEVDANVEPQESNEESKIIELDQNVIQFSVGLTVNEDINTTFYYYLSYDVINALIKVIKSKVDLSSVSEEPKKNDTNEEELEESSATICPIQFEELTDDLVADEKENMNLLMDLQLQVSVELGKVKKPIKDILQFTQGTIVELDRLAGENVDVLVSGKIIAKGEVVVVDQNFGVRITKIVLPEKRV